MKIVEDRANVIAGFYKEQQNGQRVPERYDSEDCVHLLRYLQRRVFAEYEWDIDKVLAQAEAQLRGSKRAVEQHSTVRFKFAPLSGIGSPVVLCIGIPPGAESANGPLGVWAEDPVVNEQVQSVLTEGEKKEDTIS